MQTSQVEDARVQSERLVESARQRLALWDLPAEELRRLESTRKANPTVTFPSPVNGFITEKTAVEGMRVMAGQTLYKVADLSTVWVEADVFESDAPFVRTGESAIVTLDAWPGESLRGKAVYIYPFVEEKTRTMKVRYAFANPRLRLKPGMYANVAMQASLGSGVLIPADALLDTGRQQLVFVAEGNGNFQPRDVHAGHRDGERVQIISGLKEGEEVATAAAFFLDSESQLRAAAGGWSAPAPGDSGSQAASQYTFTLRTQPDPPRNGQNTFEVRVTDAKGQPVTDAQVTVTLFMAAMPSMNMPAMSSEARLPHVGAGTYRGDGMVSMAGRWDVTMTARRGGSVLGSGRTTLVAR
jgi:RND family efflux transporter MFP subunit